MAYPPITTLPSSPSRQDPANFADEADAFLGALPAFAVQTNAAGAYIDAIGTQVDIDATAAAAASTAAIAASGATAWVSSASYTAGEVVWSLIDYQTYRARTTHTGVATDPSGDLTNWQVISSPTGPTFQAIASGSLTNGSTVIINADGTVSVVSGVVPETGSPAIFASSDTSITSSTFDTFNNKVVIAYKDIGNSEFGTAVVGTVSGTSITFGTPVVFESATTNSISSTFDSSNNKVVIAYQDTANSSFGTAIVGTVSGTSITFGTPVVFESANTSAISANFDSLNNKVVIAYSDGGNSSRGTAIVGTVSGTSISFGTAVVFETGTTLVISATFDSFNNKVVIAYRDGNNNNYGVATVGTVSGTSISFGAVTVFLLAVASILSATFDSFNNKVVIAYRDTANSNIGTAIVGTVSGTSITFGPAVVFEGSDSNLISATFDTFNNKVVIAYRDTVNSSFGTVTTGTVSGSFISFGTPVVFQSNTTLSHSIVFDTFNNKVVIAYSDSDNSGFGTAAVFKTGSTNLTEENFIGFSNGTYSDTENATIQLIGSISGGQSGLTPAQKYYVQNDGSLGTQPSDVETYAGIAVAANKIVIKG